MKNIQSTTEGTWIELIQVKLTQSDRELIESNDESTAAAKATLMHEIKNRRETPLSEEDTEIANSVYAQHKPNLKESDQYQLISANISLNGNVGRGIINCRVNGEHIQVRF
jgi:hypothetical protein